MMTSVYACCCLSLQSLDVLAEVVAVTLELSCEELLFGFSLDNWDDYVEQVRTHSAPATAPTVPSIAAKQQQT
jgi:hypothetical protein